MKPETTRTFDAGALARDFPPKLKDGNLRAVYAISDAAGTSSKVPVVYSRWKEMGLPPRLKEGVKAAVTPRGSFFTYDDTEAGGKAVAWYVNFADWDVFAFYGSGLFAQDEMQVAEHPVLASLREALLKEKLPVLTVEDGKAMPILVKGAERRVWVKTDANAKEGRPSGLYGNAFARADEEAVRRATVKLSPPTVSNVVAMAAPAHGTGEYTREQIRYVLATAYTGFRAARAESGEGKEVWIHTGYWGCGAFGGNRVLMTMLQIYAAELAEVDVLVFHTGDKAGMYHFEEAIQALQKVKGKAKDVDDFMGIVVKQGYRWGVSDGN